MKAYARRVALANTVSGYLINTCITWWWFGSLADATMISVVMYVISYYRNYFWNRFYERNRNA